MEEAKDKYEYNRFTGRCPSCGQQFYNEVFEAAKTFIDSYTKFQELNLEMPWEKPEIFELDGHDIYDLMDKKYKNYQIALKKYKENHK